jgi:hypothetical protein
MCEATLCLHLGTPTASLRRRDVGWLRWGKGGISQSRTLMEFAAEVTDEPIEDVGVRPLPPSSGRVPA